MKEIACTAPSTFAETDKWMKAQSLSYKMNDGADRICPLLCYQPPWAHGIPVELLEPIFGEIIDVDCQIGPDDLAFTREICWSMSMPYRDEEHRMEIFRNLLGDYLSIAVESITIHNSRTDGSITVKSKNLSLMVLNVEGKGEIGKGTGDPTFQNIGYYLRCLLHPPSDGDEVIQENFIAGYKCPGSSL